MQEEDTSAAAAEPEPGVLVPGGAVAEDADGAFVYVVEDNSVNRRTVRVGTRDGSRVRVLTGLSGGELVVAQLSPEVLDTLADGRAVTTVN